MIADRGMRYWVPTYLSQTAGRWMARRIRRHHLTHIIFLVCDHFEPRHGIQDDKVAEERMRAWREGYRELQEECHRQYGLRPLHTWFYPPHHGEKHLTALARMAFLGLGEVELHYHHNNDTRESLRTALREVLSRYHEAGLLLQCGDPPGGRFGFIHGDWALDNSAGGRLCGVNGELSVLKELGCWGDLTLPSANKCQTRKINSIYYAQDDMRYSKSHDWGVNARVGKTDQRGLLLIQGPLGFRWQKGIRPQIENASLTSPNWGNAERIRSWINCNIHVRGRPEWLFVKLHTHGAIERDFDALFGERARRMHRMLAEQYNDGRIFRLHYVTARQAYNLVRAAESGASGDPEQFLEGEVAPPVTSVYWANFRHKTKVCNAERLMLETSFTETEATVALHNRRILGLSGEFISLDITDRSVVMQLPRDKKKAPIRITLRDGSRVRSVAGAQFHVKGQEVELLQWLSAEIRVELDDDTEQPDVRCSS